VFEQDRLDEEVKKKKRRVLVVLLVLLLGTGMILPVVDLTSSPATPVPKAAELPTRTAVPTQPPASPTSRPTETAAPTTTPQSTATATHIPVAPTATEELGGRGGGEPDASPAPTAAPERASSTPAEIVLLPETGADAGKSGWLGMGLVVVLLGGLLLVGSALHARR
jgi:hypothetical protein